ncbi:tRNA (adenosine(37)-N6)-threonylcarbamoyltransferase complex dimerization subunit type 1 TsaB [Micavibrio aeruginosavorus]|uniref:Glycoprotease family protein n=1 Tax=Micavibrio aeruginosavorus (strain ARL-13) TaxID=856793 RepID=G2KSH7_MICAA|nr:tRNA (adenosine(37)-N6)-threonylcarbamoyltransferase complex dimerization subunit type 1 TsaB [Micavibrio aeruginosavorus]AEP09261.1 glycoprotease family protein [Micavibrio aeruginosavorus ARL-13]
MSDLSKPCILAIDTSMAACNVAVFDTISMAGTSRAEPMARGQSEDLVPMINDVLSMAERSYNDVGLIVVTVGPGAFTGVRIALSAARAFGLTLNCPVVGVLSTDALAQTLIARGDVHDGETIMALMDTKRGDYYAQLFTAEGAALTEPLVMKRDELPDLIAEHSVVVVGDCQHIAATLNGARVASEIVFPDMDRMARVAAIRWARGGAEAFLSPEPVYLRGAEVSQPKKKGRTIADNQ